MGIPYKKRKSHLRGMGFHISLVTQYTFIAKKGRKGSVCLQMIIPQHAHFNPIS